MASSFARKIVPALVFLVLALVYGGYMKINISSQDAKIAAEWDTIRTHLAARAELTQKFVKKVGEFAPTANEASADATAGQGALPAQSADAESANGANAAAEADANADAKAFRLILEKLSKYAAIAGAATTPTLGANADLSISQELGSLLFAVKDNAELRADPEYQSLLRQLADAETALTDARGRYNALVMKGNTLLVKFPGKFVAPLFRLEPREYFNATEDGLPTTHPVLQLNPDAFQQSPDADAAPVPLPAP